MSAGNMYDCPSTDRARISADMGASLSKSAIPTMPSTAISSTVVPSGTVQIAIAASLSDSLTKTNGTLKLKSRSDGPANVHVDPSKVAVGSLGSEQPEATRPTRTINVRNKTPGFVNVHTGWLRSTDGVLTP